MLNAVNSVIAAARNNADWCAAMCAAHGLASRFDADAWVTERRSPPMYPDAVTLTPGVSGGGLLARIDAGPGCSVKDSYADLDLGSAGFEVLFAASWIHRSAGATGDLPSRTGRPGAIVWSPVADPGELAEWAAAHGGGHVFAPQLLGDPAVTILAGRRGGALVAGVVTNVSTVPGLGPVAGVSNLFAAAGEDEPDVWAGATVAVAARHPGLPLVGYEAGGSLAAAERVGFEPVGDLRIWFTP
jgi:hypothetical protein